MWEPYLDFSVSLNEWTHTSPNKDSLNLKVQSEGPKQEKRKNACRRYFKMLSGDLDVSDGYCNAIIYVCLLGYVIVFDILVRVVSLVEKAVARRSFEKTVECESRYNAPSGRPIEIINTDACTILNTTTYNIELFKYLIHH